MTFISPPTLSLPEIASWQFPELPNTLGTSKPQIIAAIPSLQRGAVWKPGQVEMLWDSILRGFPIGALVMCPKFEGQDYHSGKHGKGWADEHVTHYLLDGQQRCNAIALGFLDALRAVDDEQPQATLWVDLDPVLTKNSTRHFVLRVLTASHPWGYTMADDAGFIGVGDIRDAVKQYEGGKRPPITTAWPYKSECPIPFSWLTQVAFQKNEAADFWGLILDKCQSDVFKARPWALKAAKLIGAHRGRPCCHLERIETALKKAKDFRLVALQVPQDVLLQKSLQEETHTAPQPEGDERVHNVEHLFQRLNSAGTELRGEELLFSMIKAYWPAIEKSFAEIRDGLGHAFLPMPGSRLATLGIRAAMMSEQKPRSLPTSPSIPQIRSLAFPKDEKSREQRDVIKKYLGIPEKEQMQSEAPTRDSDLHKNLRQVDAWLLFDRTRQDDIGLPPVLRSSLAQGAPDVYLLLLYLAQRARNESLDAEAMVALRKPILGLATALHWFGINHDVAAGQVLTILNDRPLVPNSFKGLLALCMPAGDKHGVLNILPSEQLADLVKPVLETDPALRAWTLWGSLVGNETDTEARQKAENSLWPFVHKTIHSRPLLLYAQRRYLSVQFESYDPSCVDVWTGHDRPWDYDHILPSAVIYRKHNQEFKSACSQWTGTIGNLRAWPLEANRSKSDDMAIRTITTPEDRSNSLITAEVENKDQDECLAFSMCEQDINDPSKVARFMNAARSRMLRIYAEWYDSLEISRLLVATREN
jgi:hypothetical protein